METSLHTTAVLSPDADLRAELRAGWGPSCGVVVSLEVDTALALITREVVERTVAADPSLLILDIEADPTVGLQLAAFFAGALAHGSVIVIGPEHPRIVQGAYRAGAAEYLMRPLSAGDLREAVERATAARASAPAVETREPAKLVLLAGAKGGAGTTTVAVNLAAEMTRRGAGRVLLLDLDLELGGVAQYVRPEAHFDVVDLARNLQRLDAGLLDSFRVSKPEGMSLLVAPDDPEKATGIGSEAMTGVLDYLRDHFDWIIADVGRPLSVRSRVALAEAAALFLVVSDDVAGVTNARRLAPLLRSHLPTDASISLLLNRRRRDAALPVAEIARVTGIEKVHALPEDSASAQAAVETGDFLVSGRSALGRELAGLASRLLGTEPEPKRGLFRFRR